MANDMTPEQLFTEARSFKFFSDRPVGEDQLRALYDIAKFAPSASNSCPMRITFVTSPEGKEKVLLRGAATFESWKRAPLCVVEFG